MKQQPKSVSPIEKYWLIQQFEQIDKMLKLILAEVRKGSEPNPNVIPALEEIVKKVALRATAIDLKVPDTSGHPPDSVKPPPG